MKNSLKKSQYSYKDVINYLSIKQKGFFFDKQ